MEYYAAIRENEILPLAATRTAEGVMLSGRGQRKTVTDDITYVWNLKKCNGQNKHHKKKQAYDTEKC